MGYFLDIVLPFADEGERLRWSPAVLRLRERLMLLAQGTEDVPQSALIEVTGSIVGHGDEPPMGLIEAYEHRNTVAVSHMDVLLAVWDGRRTGNTADQIGKAVTQGLPVIWIDARRRVTVLPHPGKLGTALGVLAPASA
jgi:hypothetical protein